MALQDIDRRQAIGLIGAAAAAVAITPGTAAAAAPTPPQMAMWRDPGCGCCSAWAQRVEAAFGTKLPVTDSNDMPALKTKHGVPEDLRSCHTALIGGYVIEGHVPPADIWRLIATRPAGVKGLAVPGMPMGSPGMDFAHAPNQPFKVFAFGASRSVFAAHG
ncbi:MAG: DUF411 domain-containing protein [Alphaproteobacteria bacterium]|nr:MAG: DUF411 domain-containing protein [Alphaproteobacteria bacterium]